MNEMIERVARAICEVDGDSPYAWRDGTDRNPERAYREAARAAIAALRVPSVDMGLAAYAAWDAFGEDAVMGPEEAIAIWQAMIDAILEET